MNKKLFLAMSRRRVSCPLTVQQLWDAVKIIRYKRQVPDIERITRYMNRVHNVSDDEVGRQINYCVRDGLLKVIKKVGSKGSKVGVEQEGYKLPDEKAEKDTHDWYCFECHSGGDVICCTSCHRVFHLSCISKEEIPEDDVKNKFVCIVCKRCANVDLTPKIKRSQLNRLLKYTATKMKDRLPVALTDRQPPSNTSYLSERFAIQGQVRSPSIDVPSNFKWVLNDKEEWRVNYLIFRPVDLHIMESKADCRKYEHLEEFRADIQTIVHNVVIYHGVHSNMADMARLMLRDCSTDLQEILECWLCYKHCNDKTLRNWFMKPCKPPHELVYAKPKGYPYWPAKVIKENQNMGTYDVRFFGGVHERAVVEKSFIRPISVNIHTLQVKRTSSWNKACEELKRYQKQLEKLRQETDNFTKPFQDSSSDDSDTSDTFPYSSSRRVIGEEVNTDSPAVPILTTTTTTAATPTATDISGGTTNTASAATTAKTAEYHHKHKKSTRRHGGNGDGEGNGEGDREEDDKKYIRPRGRPKKFNLSASSSSQEVALHGSQQQQQQQQQQRNPKAIRSRGRPSKSVSSCVVAAKSFGNQTTAATGGDLLSNSDSIDSKPNRTIHVHLTKLQHTDKEEHNISSSSSGKLHAASKNDEEEIVSSSSSSQNSALRRSVKTQTKPIDNKPSSPPPPPPPPSQPPPPPPKEWIEKMEEEFEQEKQKLVAKLTKEHEQEIALLRQAHTTILSETKRKQWCVNCESEAIYHCCWNTSYCSPECQLAHWAADHKRHCRRKR